MAKTSNPKRGYHKGEHLSYVPGHHVKSGPENHKWKGGRWTHKTGYVYVYVPERPRANRDGYVLEHRLILEQKLGRPLRDDEDGHHINGVKDDNRPENLVALTKQRHHELHGGVELRAYHKANPEKNRESGRKGASARWGKTE